MAESAAAQPAPRLPANVVNRYRAQWSFARGETVPAALPAVLQVALNNRCNLKCVYCSEQRVDNTYPRTELGAEVFATLERDLDHVETLAFHGVSEFFIDLRFFPLIERCARAGSSLSLNTNGTVMTPRHVQALATFPGALEINFSLDAATAPTFKRIRGADLDRVVANIRAYLAAFAARPRALLRTSVSFVILRSNVEEMVDFVRLARDLGVDEAKFYRLHEYGGLDWKIAGHDGTPFDYRAESPRLFMARCNEQIAAATAAAAAAHLELEIPAPFTAAELAESAS